MSKKLKVFISYRRDDGFAAGTVGRIYDRLRDRYGAENVFMDVDTIPPGVDFATQIDQAVARADVMLAVMGPDWLRILREKSGEQADFVRVEIESALGRDIPVVPLLVRGAAIPGASELPEGIAALSRRNGVPIDPGRDFDAHVSRLLSDLESHLESKEAGEPRENSTPPGGDRPQRILRLLNHFFWPIEARLARDDALWEEILHLGSSDPSKQRIAAEFETNHILPNHEAILGIIDGNRYLLDHDQNLNERAVPDLHKAIRAYQRHVAVYRAIRSSGDSVRLPINDEAPWPHHFPTLIRTKAGELVAEYTALTGSAPARSIP